MLVKFKNDMQLECLSAVYVTNDSLPYIKIDLNVSDLSPIKSLLAEADFSNVKIYTEEKDNFDKAYPNAQREHLDYFINQKNHYSGKWGGLEELVAETNALRDSYTTEDYLAPRVQYLQQFYPRTIAYINDKLENYKG